MNKTIKNALDKMVALDSYITSTEGYPIYDLMQEIKVDNGNGQKLDRWGASGIVFYTEDENILENLLALRNKGELVELKQFLIANHDFLRPLNNKDYPAIPEMNHHERSAFAHLATSSSKKTTFKEGYYGVAHLIEEDQLFIFYQNHPAISELYKGDLNKGENYLIAQQRLKQAYEEGKIKPQGVIKGNAFNIVIESLLEFNIKKMSEFQKDTILVLKQFNETLHGNNVDFSTVIKNGIHKAVFKYADNKIEVIIPVNKKDGLSLVVNDGIEEDSEYKMHLPQALYFINKEVASSNVAKFMKKLKI